MPISSMCSSGWNSASNQASKKAWAWSRSSTASATRSTRRTKLIACPAAAPLPGRGAETPQGPQDNPLLQQPLGEGLTAAGHVVGKHKVRLAGKAAQAELGHASQEEVALAHDQLQARLSVLPIIQARHGGPDGRAAGVERKHGVLKVLDDLRL